MYKISFCTAVRNRLHHLKFTLSQNLLDNQDYENVQFVVLDYNSDDGLAGWIESNLYSYIQSGRLAYYRTNSPEYFHRSHSRNMAFKLAEGDIVCNVDADNYTGPGFAKYINSLFEKDSEMIITSGAGQTDFIGRIGCKKKDFEFIGGFDEAMDGYGYEDFDFIRRLKLSGLKDEPIRERQFFKAITHNDKERISEEKIFRSLSKIYVSHVNPSQSDILLLLKDSTFKKGRLTDRGTLNSDKIWFALKPADYDYEFVLSKPDWESGEWVESPTSLKLHHTEGETISMEKKAGDRLVVNRKYYLSLNEMETMTTVILFYNQFKNRKKMKDNALTSKVKINNTFGQGTVYKNFNLLQKLDVL